MTTTSITNHIRRKKSFLCVGLDVDLARVPKHLLETDDPIFEFNRSIIDATAPYCVAFKPNTAFYEAHGVKGWKALEKTIQYLNAHYPDHFTIADAKRGDIGNTSRMYAKAFFQDMAFDSVTVAPYMGSDSVEPFLEFEQKHTILLALTSNHGSADFQNFSDGDSTLYQRVIHTALKWQGSERLMFVVGATKASHLSAIRQLIPEHFLLIPGVGAQGGSLDEVCRHGLNANIGLLINSSRGIIYASAGEDFAEAAAREAQTLQKQMEKWISR